MPITFWMFGSVAGFGILPTPQYLQEWMPAVVWGLEQSKEGMGG